MASLEHCLKLYGDLFTSEEKKALRAESRGLVAKQKIPFKQAMIQVAEFRKNEAQVEYDKIEKIIEKYIGVAEKPKAEVVPRVEKKVEKPIVKIPEFKSTEDALAFGKIATPEQIEALKAKREESQTKSDALKDKGDLQGAMDEAIRGQFFREAISKTAPLDKDDKVEEEFPSKVARRLFEPEAKYGRPDNEKLVQDLNDKLAKQFGDKEWENAYNVSTEDSARDGPIAKIAQAMEKTFKINIVPITPTEKRFSVIGGQFYKGTMFIDTKATKGFVQLSGHELLHHIKRERPDLYEAFIPAARDGYKRIEKFRIELNKLLLPGEEELSAKAAEEELIADFTGDALADPKFLKYFAGKDENIFKKFMRAVIGWLKDVSSKLSKEGFGSSEHFTDVNNLRKYLDVMLHDFAERENINNIDNVLPPKFSRIGKAEKEEDLGAWADDLIAQTLKKDIPPKTPPKVASPYEQHKDDWFGNKDWGELRNAVEKNNLQKAIKETVGKSKNIFGKKYFDKECRDTDAAIHIYLDLKRNPEHLEDFYKNLTKEQQRIVDLAQTIEDNPKLKALADYIADEYDKIGKMALGAGVIRNVLDNYVTRTWKIEGKQTTDVSQKFKTSSRHAKHRVFETILEGQASGYALQTSGATSNLNVLKDEVGRVIEDKKLIEEMRSIKRQDGSSLLSTHMAHETDRRIEHPNFKVWEKATYVKLRKRVVNKATGLAINDRVRIGDKKAIGKVVDISDTEVTITFKVGESKELREIPIDPEGGISNVIRVKPKGKNFFISDSGIVYEKRELYAPEEIAKDLNRILGVSRLKGVPGFDALTKYNAIFKSWILVTSFFHHCAFLRSYYLPTQHKTLKEWRPIKTYKEGRKAINEFKPELELLVRNGLTMFKMQDWEESILRRDSTVFGKVLDKTAPTKVIKNKINDLRERQANFLFGNFGAALKTQAALIELRNMTREHPEMDVNERAKMVARLINADFGGLHHGRMGRDPTVQHIMRLLLLAPDWTESNVRTMVGAFRAGGSKETAMYRKFWASAITKGLSAVFIANVLLAAFDDDDFVERYKKAWETGHFRWLDIDITPIYKMFGGEAEVQKYFSLFGHFRDPLKFITHPIRSLHHKGSVVYGSVHEAMGGTDWRGQRFTTLSELMGADDKGVYLTTTKTHKMGEPKGGKLVGKTTTYISGKKGPVSFEQMPSYAISQLIGVQPIQIQNLIAMLAGEVAAFDAIARSLGMHTSTTYPEKGRRFRPPTGKDSIWVGVLGTTKEMDTIQSEIKRLVDTGLLTSSMKPGRRDIIGRMKKKIELTDEQYSQLVSDTEKAERKRLERFVGREGWEDMTDERKVSIIKRSIAKARAKARKDLRREIMRINP